MTFGDGSHSQFLGKWTIDILRLPLLTNVLYIKGLKVNLLSITQICDEDFLVQFSKKGCVILNEEGVQILKGLITTDNCYGVVSKPNVSCRSVRVNSLVMPTTSKWQRFPNLKPWLVYQSSERLGKMFVVHVNRENKPNQAIPKWMLLPHLELWSYFMLI